LSKTHETVKLFYKKYLYKIKFSHCSARLFKNIAGVEKRLEKIDSVLQQHGEIDISVAGYRFRPKVNVTRESLTSLRQLYRMLKQHSDHKLMISRSKMFVYTNNRRLLNSIISFAGDDYELWEPDSAVSDVLLHSPNVIVTNKPVTHQYKITLKNQKNRDFVAWLGANRDKVKVGSLCLHLLTCKSWISDLYFYARDEKVLKLAQLTGMEIARIEKLVHKNDLDK
jgi:hypothetical protein